MSGAIAVCRDAAQNVPRFRSGILTQNGKSGNEAMRRNKDGNFGFEAI